MITASNLEPRHWILDGDLSPLRGQDSFSRDALQSASNICYHKNAHLPIDLTRLLATSSPGRECDPS
jgi:hypothetical protein